MTTYRFCYVAFSRHFVQPFSNLTFYLVVRHVTRWNRLVKVHSEGCIAICGGQPNYSAIGIPRDLPSSRVLHQMMPSPWCRISLEVRPCLLWRLRFVCIYKLCVILPRIWCICNGILWRDLMIGDNKNECIQVFCSGKNGIISSDDRDSWRFALQTLTS